MSTFLRKKLSTNFTTLPNSLIRDPNLSWKATGFLSYLLSCADGWELNFADLSKRKKDGEAATRAAAAELKEIGYLKINSIRSEKGRIERFEWVVSDQPELQNPDVDYPDVDFPHLDNRGQRKNNSIRNSFNKKQPQQPAAGAAGSTPPAEQVGGGGSLIFDKAIDQNLHQKLIILLADVELKLAQQMLDVLTAMGAQANSPLRLIKSFVANQDDFDPAPGFTIARKRENERMEVEKRRVENERIAKPKNYTAAERFKEKRAALGI